MNIIEAEEKDIVLLRDLAKKSWMANYAEILSQEQIDYMLEQMYSEKELQQHLKNPDYFYFLIQDESRDFVGFMGFEINYEPNTTKLHRIYLLKESKGKGLGKALMDFLLHKTRAFGNHRIILNVNKHNPAKTFYEKLGYHVYDEGVFDIGNGFVMDDFLMEFLI